MGARVSISFKKGSEESVTLFSHWGGDEFAKEADDYTTKLKEELGEQESGISRPLDRLEPNTVMVDFIRYITKDMDRVVSDLYLGADSVDGDNSDYGHHTISLDEQRATNVV